MDADGDADCDGDQRERAEGERLPVRGRVGVHAGEESHQRDRHQQDQYLHDGEVGVSDGLVEAAVGEEARHHRRDVGEGEHEITRSTRPVPRCVRWRSRSGSEGAGARPVARWSTSCRQACGLTFHADRAEDRAKHVRNDGADQPPVARHLRPRHRVRRGGAALVAEDRPAGPVGSYEQMAGDLAPSRLREARELTATMSCHTMSGFQNVPTAPNTTSRPGISPSSSHPRKAPGSRRASGLGSDDRSPGIRLGTLRAVISADTSTDLVVRKSKFLRPRRRRGIRVDDHVLGQDHVVVGSWASRRSAPVDGPRSTRVVSWRPPLHDPSVADVDRRLTRSLDISIPRVRRGSGQCRAASRGGRCALLIPSGGL